MEDPPLGPEPGPESFGNPRDRLNGSNPLEIGDGIDHRQKIRAMAEDLCLDAVSRPDAFALLWPKLRAGYLLDALERLDGKPTRADATDGFVQDVAGALTTRQPSAGLGEDVRLRGERVIASWLELDGEVIQLSAFTSRDGGRRAFGRIARPSRRR